MFPYFDGSLAEPIGRLLGGSYELVLGRRTYEIFAAYRPHSGDQPIGEKFNAVHKHVVAGGNLPDSAEAVSGSGAPYPAAGPRENALRPR